MKKIILLTGFILIYSATFAQKQQYKLVEGELGGAMPFGWTTTPLPTGVQSKGLGYGLYGELRFNLPNRHLSIGTQVCFWFAGTIVTVTDYSTARYNSRECIAQGTVVDYNFNEIKGFLLPFVGSGIGLASVSDNDDASARPYISPRIGVEVWNRLRFSFGYNLTHYEYSGFIIKLGFVFGGGKKKSDSNDSGTPLKIKKKKKSGE
jgi:hypothetical protein